MSDKEEWIKPEMKILNTGITKEQCLKLSEHDAMKHLNDTHIKQTDTSTMKKIITVLFIVSSLTTISHAQQTARVKQTPQEQAAKECKALKKKLDLTDEQVQKITAIFAERDTKIADGKGLPEAGSVIKQADEDANNQVDVLLTPDQKKIFGQMVTDKKSKKTTQKFLIPNSKAKKRF
ncbi:hypothetical protein KXQ82_04545 [Mucilaginibacter sp. HMF5004]|uniref:hypothetical protein n=1 Tax=Mucilaginibacter rivuli TaxID=2857527 RepID=UPI001C5F82BE|nr:hypothetical protein [Mucilaginibacter rivuli]MBW4888967.1 hypothetical protein [Mucilaginibacter rivuli]